MGGSLPEMDEWDAVFDEFYLERISRSSTKSGLAPRHGGRLRSPRSPPGAEILDFPGVSCFARAEVDRPPARGFASIGSAAYAERPGRS